jgi:hypothetical protein
LTGGELDFRMGVDFMNRMQWRVRAVPRRYTQLFRGFALLAVLSAACLVQAQDRPWAWSAGNNGGNPQPAVHRTQLATGTAIRMRLETGIAGKGNKPNRTFSANVTEPVMLNGETIIPAGATVSGRVANIANPRRIHGKPSVDLRPDKLSLPDGRTMSISAVIVDTGNPRRFDVDNEGRIKTTPRSTHDTRETLIGTGAGAGVGAILGGVPGALIGATAGAGATTAHRLLRHRYAELPAGTVLIVELRRPLLFEEALALDNPYNGSPYNTGQYNTGQYNSAPYDGNQYDRGQYNHGQYDRRPYDNGQYDPGQYNSGQYDSGQYDSRQYNGGTYRRN